MRTPCGYAKCIICGARFAKMSANAQVCGDECRRERDNRRKRKGGGPKVGHREYVCVICGVRFVGRLPNYPYKCCGSKECRYELRKVSGRRTAERMEARLRASGVARECLRCGKGFRAPNRFIRLCGECKANREVNTLGADWWPGVVI